jgi:dCMP deaminase
VVPNWHQWFATLAAQVSVKSKDRSTKVGAILVRDNRILATGYNGFPCRIDDDVLERHTRPLKYPYTVHAEANAILQCALHGVSARDADMYVTTPWVCAECAKCLIQAGVKRVLAPDLPMTFKGTELRWTCAIARNMLLEAGVHLWLMDSSGGRACTCAPVKVPDRATYNATATAEWEKLTDAMEMHGNTEGKEAQLDSAMTFLRRAMGQLTPEQAQAVFADADTREYTAQYAVKKGSV